MKRFATAATLGLLALLVLALPGATAKRWCMTEPIVRLGGVEYQILVGVPDQNTAQIIGPLAFVIVTPEDLSHALLFTDAGYNGHGEKVVFTQREISKHRVYLDVPHTGNTFPVLVEVYQNGELLVSAEGTSDVMQVDLPVVSSSGDGEED